MAAFSKLTRAVTVVAALAGSALAMQVTGVQDSAVHPRIEIRDLEKNADQWNLFLLAMQDFKSIDQSEMLSYYQVAGIHGVPNVPWDDVQPASNNGGAVGYCTHITPIFPPWHRIYLALFEQTLMTSVQNVVNSFSGSDKTRYAAAAANFRMVYWDWAAVPGDGQDVLPASITSNVVTVNTPTGTQQIPNPLFRYDYNPLDKAAMIEDPWDFWSTTLRWPSTTSSPNAVSQNDQAASAMTGNAANVRANVYNMFTQCTDYMEMASDAATASTPNCHNSLESIHDGIHTALGGSNDGHMTVLWYAAHDPVFWLHHANVDRLFAMWQALYPDSYITSGQSGASTYTAPSGTTVDGNTGLTPFHADNAGNFWTADQVRNITTFKYTYPEFVETDGSPQAMMGVVNQLYGNGATPAKAFSESASSAPTSSATSATSAKLALPTSSSGASSGQSSSSLAGASSGASSTVLSSATSAVSSGSAGSVITPTGGHTALATPSGPGGLLGGAGGMLGGVSSMMNSIGGALGSMGLLPTGGHSAPGLASALGSMPSGLPTSPNFPKLNPGQSVPFPIAGGNSSSLASNASSLLTPTGMTHDYNCNIASQRFGLGGSYTVYVFFGEAPANPPDYPSAKNLVGSHGVFSTPGMTMNHAVTTGSISLTSALVGKVASGELKSMDSADVTPYLTKNMVWKVWRSNGQTIDAGQVPGMTVAVAYANVMPAPNANTFPTWGNWQVNNTITHGKPGGLQQNMQWDWWNVCGKAPTSM